MPRKKIDTSLPKVCRFRYDDEMIGFEGVLVPMCCSKEHPGSANIYPRCSTEYCPLKSVNNNQ